MIVLDPVGTTCPASEFDVRSTSTPCFSNKDRLGLGLSIDDGTEDYTEISRTPQIHQIQ